METNKKLSGWLILVHIILYIAPIIYFLYAIFFFLFSGGGVFGLGILGLVWGLTGLGLGIFHIYILQSFYSKKRKFPLLAIISAWIPIAFAFFITIISSITSLLWIIVYSIPAIIWTIYFKKSKRVKDTFVN